MRCRCSVGDLRDALKIAQLCVPHVPVRAEFGGVLFMVGATTSSVVGSRNAEVTIATHFSAEPQDPGRVLAPPAPLAAYLATFESDQLVTVSYDDEATELEVSVQGHRPYTLRVLSGTLPLPPVPPAPPAEVDFSRLPLALGAVRSSVNRETNAVQVVSSAAGLALHTTDLYRLSRCVLPEASFGDVTAELPLEVLEWAAKFDARHVTLETAARTVRFAGPGVVISARLLRETFPPVEALFSVPPPYSTRVGSPQLRQALSRLRALDRSAPLRCTFSNSTLTLTSTTTDVGRGEEDVELLLPVAEPFECLLRPDFLYESLGALGSSDITLSYRGSLEPLHLAVTDPLAATILLQPVRP